MSASGERKSISAALIFVNVLPLLCVCYTSPLYVQVASDNDDLALLTLSTEACVRGCEVGVADGTPGEFRTVVFSMSSVRIAIQGLTPACGMPIKDATWAAPRPTPTGATCW